MVSRSLLLAAAACLVPSALAQTPLLQPASLRNSTAPPGSPQAVSANVTGSLGYECSSQAGILSLLQGVVAGKDTAGLNVPVPATVSDPVSLANISQIAWQYIVTYQPIYFAKVLAGNSKNGTAINSFGAKSTQLSSPAALTIGTSVTPNTDTLYATGFLDLSQGPQIVTVPQFNDSRYWIVQFDDAYSNFYHALGSDFQTAAGNYLVVGPDYAKGTVFANFTAANTIYSPTFINFLLGRVLVLNASDTATAAAYNLAYNISPYNATRGSGGTNTTSKAAIISQAIGGGSFAPYPTQIGYLAGTARSSPALWFSAAATYYQQDPPVPGATGATVQALAQLAANPVGNSALEFSVGANVALQCIVNASTYLVTPTNWKFHNTTGVYRNPITNSTDFFLRAQDTQTIPEPLPPFEVIYFQTAVDVNGNPIDARYNNYTVTFNLPVAAGQGGFFSLINYNAVTLQLVNNTINRYEIGDRTAGLVFSGPNNNTLVVYVSATAPPVGTPQYANWLPATPDAPSYFILRTYLPPAYSILGQYAPPGFVPIGPSPSPTPEPDHFHGDDILQDLRRAHDALGRLIVHDEALNATREGREH